MVSVWYLIPMSAKETVAYPLRLEPDEYEQAKKHAAHRRVSLSIWLRHLVRREVGMPTLESAPDRDAA